MSAVTYTHPTSDARVITAADWKSLGIEDQGKVTWDKSNRFTAEVSAEAAEWLLQDDPDHMSLAGSSPAEAVVEDDEEDEPDTGSTTVPSKAAGSVKKAARRA